MVTDLVATTQIPRKIILVLDAVFCQFWDETVCQLNHQQSCQVASRSFLAETVEGRIEPFERTISYEHDLTAFTVSATAL